MVALNSGVRFVVRLRWLEDSAAAGHPLVVSSKYFVRDRVKEKLWGFCLADTLVVARGKGRGRAEGEEEGHRTLVFAEYVVYATAGVCGKYAPPGEDMKSIVESGGGVWVSSLDALKSLLAERPELKAKVLLISAADVIKKVTAVEKKISASGAGRGIYSPELLFLAVLRQRLDLNDNLLT